MAKDEMVRAGTGERDNAGEDNTGDPRPPRETGAGTGVRPVTMFRWGVYVSAGVLAVLVAAAAVYTTRAVLVRVLIALFIAISLDPAVRMLTRRAYGAGWPCW